jgi:hypothetical protein
MLGRPVTFAIALAVLAALAFFGNCSKAQAGFLLSNDTNKTSDWLSSSETDNAGSPLCQSSSTAPATLDPVENPQPSPENPDNPLARGNILNNYFGLLDGRGSSSSGAGGSSSTNSGGSGSPIVASILVLASAPVGMGYAHIDPDAVPPTSVASRLFRPPRCSYSSRLLGR